MNDIEVSVAEIVEEECKGLSVQNNIFKKEPIPMPDINYRISLLRMERAMRKDPRTVPGSFFPLEHTFAHGMYIRQIFVPAGFLVLTYIHKQSHPAFLLQGDVTVIEENGNRRIQAPKSFITKAGTQRLCFCHTDTIWTTVHLNLNNEKDIDKIEDEIYALHYNELLPEEIQTDLIIINKKEEALNVL